MAERAKRKQKPTEKQVGILRSIQRSGRMIVEMKGGKPFYCCDNMEIDREDAERLIRNGWVKPMDRPLIGETPQSWIVAHTPSGG